MKKLNFLFALLLSNVLFSQINSEKYHRAKIIYNTSENFIKLEQLGLALDHGIHKKGIYIISDFSDSEIQKARNIGAAVEIEINDVQKYYVDQNKNQATQSIQNVNCVDETLQYTTPFNFNLGSMGGYFTYQEALQELDDMYAAYPNLIAQRQNIGTFLTDEGRALQWTKISNNPNTTSTKPQVLYTAIHHAREPISLSETIYFMWYLLENYDSNLEVKYIVDNTDLYFIPVINPDGYVYNQTTNPNGGGMWRKNRHNNGDGTFGVDPNRNYDYWKNGDMNQSVWNTLGVSTNTSGETYPGTSAFSENETQAVKFFVENHNFVYAINAHTFSNLLLYPFGYDLNVPSPDNNFLDTVSQQLVSQNKFTNQIASALYAASGSSDDFMYGQTQNHSKIFAMTPEIGSSFWPASNEIITLCNQMMFSNLTTPKLTLDYAKIDSNDSTFTGNSAGFLANFEITKLGLSNQGNYTVSINPISSNIESVGQPVTISNLQTLQNFTSSISITLSNGTISGDEILYEIVLNNGSFSEKILIKRIFGQLQTITTNDCSVIAPNFTTTASNPWAITTESFVSPSTSITDSTNGQYANNQTKTITSTNSIVVPITPTYLTFQTKFDLEKDYDYVEFQIATNASFNNYVSQCGKRTTMLNPNILVNPFPVYTGTQFNWVEELIDLSQYAGQTIKYRFRLFTDGFVTADGFYFDDIALKTLENFTLSTTKSEISNLIISPNPTKTFLNISCSESNYFIKVYSTQGQILKTFQTNNTINSINISNLSAGIYFVKIETEGKSSTKKFIKL